MARLNIEERFWMDTRLKALSSKLGSEFMAAGSLLFFWRLAQEQYKKGRLISESQFKLGGFPDALFDCEFAERTPEGIRAKGDKTNFKWIIDKINAGKRGGIISGKSRSSKVKDLGEANAKQNEAEPKQNEPSYLLSPISNLSNKKIRTKGDGSTNRSADFIGIYVKAFQKRYPGSRPEISGKVLGQIKTFLKDRTFERSCDLIQAYFQMEDPWFLKKAHDFSTFLSNIQKIATSLDMGVEDPNSELAKFSRKMALREKEEELLLESN